MNVNDVLDLIDKRIDELRSLKHLDKNSDMFGSFLMEAYNIKIMILNERIDSAVRESKNV